jgi:hypothetical protein
MKRKFFDELVKQELILAWAGKNDIESDPQFIKSFEEMSKLVKRSLLVQNFETKLFEGINVSDSEIKDHFEQNKSKFVKDAGGVMVIGIEFNNKEKAAAFFDKVKDKKADFAEIAGKEKDGEFKCSLRSSDHISVSKVLEKAPPIELTPSTGPMFNRQIVNVTGSFSSSV